MRPLLALVLLAGCSDYELKGEKDNDQPFDTGDSSPFDTQEETDAPAEEVCDGVDNDQDGEIDEGFGDVDADGVADCLDDTCVPDRPTPRAETREDCEGGESTGIPPADPWSVKVEWQYTGSGVCSTPAVGDLDQDGVPEVVFSDAGGGGTLVVADGATGRAEWTKAGMDPYSGPSLGDIDGDGWGDVVMTIGGCYSAHTVVAFDRDGNEMWRTNIGLACETFAAIGDLEGDGDVEVVVNEYILDGTTGAVEATLEVDGSNNWGAPALADMDQDGDQEILLENRVYDYDGNFLWGCAAGGVGSFPQPVNADADPEGELLVAYPAGIALCDDGGGVLWQQRTSSGYGSAIAVADFDDDGVQEYAFAASNQLRLIEPDGTDRWVTRITDGSGLAGTTSWDVDYDGVPEVVYADEVSIMVVNGATGAIVMQNYSHSSWTASETPAVADVDGDGSGELVYGSTGGAYVGLTVVGSMDGDWPYSRPVYNQYTYYSDNIYDDLTVPTYAEAPWMTPANLFRGQPSAVFTAARPNAVVAIGDLCVASCDAGGVVDFWVQVWNNGGAALPAGTPVDIYGNGSGSMALIDSVSLSADLEPASSVEIEVSSTIEQVGTQLRVVVNEADADDECDPTDNEDSWADVPCP